MPDIRSLLHLVRGLPPDAPIPAGLVLEHLDGGRGEAAFPRVDLTVGEVAELFGRAVSTVRTWCIQGRLPGAYRLRGREWRIPPEAIRAFQEAER